MVEQLADLAVGDEVYVPVNMFAWAGNRTHMWGKVVKLSTDGTAVFPVNVLFEGDALRGRRTGQYRVEEVRDVRKTAEQRRVHDAAQDTIETEADV